MIKKKNKLIHKKIKLTMKKKILINTQIRNLGSIIIIIMNNMIMKMILENTKRKINQIINLINVKMNTKIIINIKNIIQMMIMNIQKSYLLIKIKYNMKKKSLIKIIKKIKTFRITTIIIINIIKKDHTKGILNKKMSNM